MIELFVLFGTMTGGIVTPVVVRVIAVSIAASSVASAYDSGIVSATCRSYFSRFGAESCATTIVRSSSTE